MYFDFIPGCLDDFNRATYLSVSDLVNEFVSFEVAVSGIYASNTLCYTLLCKYPVCMRTFTLIGCALFVIIAVISIVYSGFTAQAVGGLILFGGGGVLVLFQDKIKTPVQRKECVIEADHVYFPGGYYFKYGYLKDRKKLEGAVIDEIRLGTFMITAKVNGNELIFLRGCKEETAVKFAESNNIPTCKPQDNWALICEEYLDTEIDASYKGRITKLLLQAGISLSEQQQIRKRVGLAMLVRTYLSMEWIYYGLYDVLLAMWLTEGKYWWAMDIALRGSGQNKA